MRSRAFLFSLLLAPALLAAADAPPALPGEALALPEVSVTGAKPKAGSQEMLWDGFEAGFTQWNSGEEGARLKSAVSGAVASEGTHAFGGAVDITDLKGDPKAGFWLQPGGIDFTGINTLGFDIYNGSDVDWKLTPILQTGNDWLWNEAPAIEIHPGWNKGLMLDLKKGSYSGKEGLQKAEKLVKINLLLRPAAPVRGALFLDRVRLSGPGAMKLAPKRLGDAQALKEYQVDTFEWSDGGMRAAYGTASRTELDPDHASEGTHGLKLVAVAKDPEQNAQFGIDKDVDLSRVQAVVVDVYNPGPPGMFAVTLSYGEWKYCEGPSSRLVTGWNHNLVFDLQASHFKSEASNWNPTGAIPDYNVKRLGFSWNAGDTGLLSLTIDNLRFIALDGLAAAAYAPAPPVRGYGSSLYTPGGAVPVTARSDWSAATEAGFSEAFSLAGQGPSLRLAYRAPKASVGAHFEWATPADLRGVKAFEIDAYNPNASSVDFGFIAQTGPNQDWNEATAIRLAPGWNRGLVLPVDGPVYKNASSGYKSGATLAGRGPDMVKRTYWTLVPTAPGTGAIHLARVQVLRSSVAPGLNLPVSAEASFKAGVDIEPVTYELWDSGVGEGSFEKSVSGWQAQAGNGFNASAISFGGEGASQGSKALKIQYRGSGNDKIGVNFNPSRGGVLPDLSKATRLRFDVYNPGPPLSVGVAFTADTSLWIESPGFILKSGWNRDITYELDAWIWQFGSGAINPGGSQPRSEFPGAMRTPARLNQVSFLFNKARVGTVWLDNIRFGYPGSSVHHYSEVEVGLRGSFGPLDLKTAVKLGHSADGSAWWLPGGMHAGLKGLGQSLTLGFGEPLAPFDDVLGLFTGKLNFGEGLVAYNSTPMEQLSSLSYEGSVAGLGLRAFGALPWGAAPFSWDGHAFGGLRAKAAGPWGLSIGATLLQQRLGYEPSADLISAPVEQSSQILGVDGQIALPFGLALRGAYAKTHWTLDTETLLIRDTQNMPVLYTKVLDPRREAWKAGASWTLGPVELSGSYQDVGYGFDNTLSDVLDRAAKAESKAVLHLDSLSALKARAEKPGSLLKGAAVSAELFTYYKLDDPAYLASYPLTDPYASDTYQFRLENGNDGPAHLGLLYQYKAERKAAQGQALQPNITTQALVPTLGTGLWSGARVNALAQWLNFDYVQGIDSQRLSYGLTLTQKLWKVHTFSLGGALFNEATMPGGGTSCAFASLRSVWTESLNSTLSYGRPAFNDKSETMWWNQDPTIRLSLEGSF